MNILNKIVSIGSLRGIFGNIQGDFKRRFKEACRQENRTVRLGDVEYKIEMKLYQTPPLNKLFKAQITHHGEILIQSKGVGDKEYFPVALVITDSRFTCLELSFLEKGGPGVSGSMVRELVYEVCRELNVPYLRFCDDAHIDIGDDKKWPISMVKKLKTGTGFYPEAQLMEGRLYLDNGTEIKQSKEEYDQAREMICQVSIQDLLPHLPQKAQGNLKRICEKYQINTDSKWVGLLEVMTQKLKNERCGWETKREAGRVIQIAQGTRFFEEGECELKGYFETVTQHRYYQVKFEIEEKQGINRKRKSSKKSVDTEGPRKRPSKPPKDKPPTKENDLTNLDWLGRFSLENLYKGMDV